METNFLFLSVFCDCFKATFLLLEKSPTERKVMWQIMHTYGSGGQVFLGFETDS